MRFFIFILFYENVILLRDEFDIGVTCETSGFFLNIKNVHKGQIQGQITLEKLAEGGYLK